MKQIKVGDKFKVAGQVLEVTGTKPGGKVELFNRTNCIQTDRWHRDVIKWERVDTKLNN